MVLSPCLLETPPPYLPSPVTMAHWKPMKIFPPIRRLQSSAKSDSAKYPLQKAAPEL